MESHEVQGVFVFSQISAPKKLAVLADRDNRKQSLVHIGVKLDKIEMK